MAAETTSGIGVRRLAAPICALLFLLFSTPALASPERLCSDSPEGHAAAPSLGEAVEAAEALLARRGAALGEAGDAALQALIVPEAAEASASPADLSRYCSAAGEAMRVARSGNQAQAQTFLLSAIRYGEAAAAPELVAPAAYRFALASVAEQARPDSRGARRARRSAADPALFEAPPEPDPASDCAYLRDPEYRRQPSWTVSMGALHCARMQAQAAGRRDLAALAALRSARLNLAASERLPGEAEAYRQEARTAALEGLADALAVDEAAGRSALVGRLVEATLDAGEWTDPAILRAIAALDAAAAGDPERSAMAAALSGRALLAAGRSAAAAESLRRAIFFESQRPQPFRLADWYLLLAEADPAGRDAAVMSAYRALEAVRPLMPLVDPLTEEPTFALHMRPVFQAAVEVQLAPTAAGGEGERIAAAQEIVEAFRQAEVQSSFGSDCVPARDPIRPADLSPGEILLYPILLDDRIELIYAAREAGEAAPRYRRVAGPAGRGREEVSRLADSMVESVAYGADAGWREPARALYDLIVAPVAARLGPETTLIIIPDGPLRAVPFAALLDGQGRFLIERTRLGVAPALSYAEPGTRSGEEPFVVAASLQQDVRLPAGFFPALAGADVEARLAAGGDEGVVISNFVRDDLRRALAGGRVNVLHLATHAAFNGRSDRSFIVSSDGAIPIRELRSLIEGGRTRGDTLDLLILSACETAVGDDQASMGLAGTAVQAGARSSIASLWQVSDSGTVELMRNFYRSYRSGSGKAEALRTAQLALISGGGDNADPGVWSAFELLGAWR